MQSCPHIKDTALKEVKFDIVRPSPIDMPAISSGKVLVTGANGYIGIWIVRTLLEKGYSVRGTVRSESKTEHLRNTFASYGDKLEFAVVEDITKEGAFDDAVKGVDAIEHTASPVYATAGDPEEMIRPAVVGTTGILKSALQHGTSIKRIVYTSSCATIITVQDTPREFSEADWNEKSIDEARVKGRDAAPTHKYYASKTLAERAAWEFVERNKETIGWDLVTLNPPFVFGPTIHEVNRLEGMNASMNEWVKNVLNGVKDTKQLSDIGLSSVDVRDVAEGHVLALQKEEAGGERMILSEGPHKWQEWVNAVREHNVEVPVAGDASFDPTKAAHHTLYDGSKANRLLGIRYRTLKETTRDLVEDWRMREWI
ncbi:uncharacterized protein FIBRA_01715 [Fibroporia radiculosa]|uniref:NAD-dependent epimerase/dehydratase domain-containing protein n=1 Tax=Fibroporia radiculosa TaxID=599839 RepID=J4H1D2_9APHY|nr:uncharacterized protein FIBRA_01715 [Fibroporia radiculosa]CCL99694.1 predicted protein [Fibroporia radiculosa]